ncbi:hypothetical protein AK830_g9708 [Neonectria ditissima]|uniref:Uncharacterized protein n=1 Tax=Neonectria ditissima TaxID=78410 RepID=A0A0P7B585_9HYPO|nr:hypothetical protein AK830_g9708 [Neonectria ditissima]
MPRASRHLTEYQRNFGFTTFRLKEDPDNPGSPTASESGLHNVFAADGEPASNKLPADNAQMDESPTDRMRPCLQTWDSKTKTPRLVISVNDQPDRMDPGWAQATQKILSFCWQNFRKATWDDLDESTRGQFIRMCPDAQRLMGMEHGCVNLFAARIWRIIDEAIFNKTKTDSVQWASPFFKHQNDMLNELRKTKPGAPYLYMTQVWREWDYRSVCLYYGTVDAAPRRILPECFVQIITDGLGPMFPKDLPHYAMDDLNGMANFFTSWEGAFSAAEDYHYFSFAHPGTGKNSGFTFRSCFSGSPAMMGIDRYRVDNNTNFEGRQVDLIVAPMIRTIPFSREDVGEIPIIHVPMIVCAGWIEDLDRMEREEAERTDDTASDQPESDRMEDKEGGSKDDGEQDEAEQDETEPDQTEDKEGGSHDVAGPDQTGKGQTGLVSMKDKASGSRHRAKPGKAKPELKRNQKRKCKKRRASESSQSGSDDVKLG